MESRLHTGLTSRRVLPPGKYDRRCQQTVCRADVIITRVMSPFAKLAILWPLLTLCYYYRTMHFSAKSGIAIACRLSVCPSVCLRRWWIVIT